MSSLGQLGSAKCWTHLRTTTARLEPLLKQAMKETDPGKSDELSAEIWRVLRERDAIRKALRVQAGMVDEIQAITRFDPSMSTKAI
jgi:hypothetical protein